MFFTDVFVPADQLVGPLHEGWRIANSTLTHERGVNPRQLVIHSQLVDELWRLALERGAFDDPRLAPRLAQAFVEVRMFQLHNWRSISRTAKGEEPGPVGSINKLWWSEMSKRLHDTAMAVLGTAATAVARRRRQPRRRGLAALVALLPGQLDLGRHQRDPAQRGGRTGAGPSSRTALNDPRSLSVSMSMPTTTSTILRSRTLLGRIVPLAFGLAACSSSGSSKTSSATGNARHHDQEHHVRSQPGAVKSGATVTVKNNDDVTHTVTSDDGNQLQRLIERGKTAHVHRARQGRHVQVPLQHPLADARQR